MSVITISRQFGAQSTFLGDTISKKIGYNFYDPQIITMVAEKAKVTENRVEGVEKRAGSKIMHFLDSFVSRDFLNRMLDGQQGNIDEETYVDLLPEILNTIYDKGNSIILGRGGQYILKGKEDAFHILMVADVKDREKVIQKEFKIAKEKAAQVIKHEDKKRVHFFHHFNKTCYDNPKHYHLVLNMSQITIEKACDLVCLLIK